MTHSRREFLRRGLFTVPTAVLAPGFLARSMMATPASSARNLIMIELEGGNDGLNTLVPFGVNGGAYYSLFRPTLNVPEGTLLKIDGELGFNPSFAGVKTLYDAGRVAVVQGVSYPNQSFSHEVAERFWAKGTEDPLADGWIARLLALDPVSSFPCAMDARESLSPAYQGTDRFVPSFKALTNFLFPYDSPYWSDKNNRRACLEAALAASLEEGDSITQTASATGEGLLTLIDTFEMLPSYSYTGTYPSHWIGDRLKMVIRLMNANLGLNLFHVPMGGYDTHSDQEVGDFHKNQLAAVSQAILGAYTDLSAMGKASDTLIVLYSEFGRSVSENASGGTDHGTVNPVFIFGDTVTGGLVNAHPTLDPSVLDANGELPMSVDLRDVLGTVIHKWYGVNSADVLLGYQHADLGFLG